MSWHHQIVREEFVLKLRRHRHCVDFADASAELMGRKKEGPGPDCDVAVPLRYARGSEGHRSPYIDAL